mmetsp:Transcript_20013/g.50782  ORF Transcript_20013/g.50782 Transcript_20013/m.50782 type:complete len:201 (+) Transcript_20013:778-1380(+)
MAPCRSPYLSRCSVAGEFALRLLLLLLLFEALPHHHGASRLVLLEVAGVRIKGRASLIRSGRSAITSTRSTQGAHSSHSTLPAAATACSSAGSMGCSTAVSSGLKGLSPEAGLFRVHHLPCPASVSALIRVTVPAACRSTITACPITAPHCWIAAAATSASLLLLPPAVPAPPLACSCSCSASLPSASSADAACCSRYCC